MTLDLLEKLFHRVAGAGQTPAEAASALEQLMVHIVKERPTFLVAPRADVWRIDKERGIVTAATVGPQGLHLRMEHVRGLQALLGGHVVFQPQQGVLLVVPVASVRLAPGDPF